MARYTGPIYRKSRRLGFSTLETGKELAKKPFAPGQHGNGRGKKLSNYGIQLQEKQKVRFMYGLNERQFEKTFKDAGAMKGVHGENFFRLLESRLDNLVFRLGFSSTRNGARQLVNHGHITVNGKKVDIASYKCIPGDIIAVKENSKEHPMIKTNLEKIVKRVEFVTYDENKMAGTYVRYPERTELNAEINDSLIVEFYNR
ncbi:MAG: 30S ribosomal protein S4 [Bacilli bacterium]